MIEHPDESEALWRRVISGVALSIMRMVAVAVGVAMIVGGCWSVWTVTELARDRQEESTVRTTARRGGKGVLTCAGLIVLPGLALIAVGVAPRWVLKQVSTEE